MKDKLYLHIPSFEEFGYRQKILAQPDTMAYNRGYELKLENWHSLFIVVNMSRKIAREIADHFGYTYPEDDDNRVTAYLQHVRDLLKMQMESIKLS